MKGADFRPSFFLMLKFVFCALFALCVSGFAADNTATRKPAASKTAARKTPSSRKGTPVRKKGSKSAASAASRNRQQVPTPERYKEIQRALVGRGYLKTEPNGVWDADSADALRRFQTDQNLSPTGKISAASLIGLGLGGSATQAAAGVPHPAAGTEVAPVETGPASAR